MNLHERTTKRGAERRDPGGAGNGIVGRVESLDRDVGAKAGRPAAKSSLVRLVARVLLPLLILAAGAGTYYYLKVTRPETPKQAKKERAFSVSSVVVRPGTYQPVLVIYGSTVAGRQVDIRSLVAGRVVSTHGQLREGGVVGAGDVLLEIDRFDYENAVAVAKAQRGEADGRRAEFEAALARDRTSLVHAKEQLALSITDLERAKPLASRGTVAKRTVDERQQVVLQRQQAVDQLTNEIEVWRARIAQQTASLERFDAAVALAQRRLKETQLKAPFNAYVSDVVTHDGRMVSANDKIATLIDRDWIEARFILSDEQFGRVVSKDGTLEGRKVKIDWELGGVTFSYDGVVERLGARVSSATGGVEVFARIDDPLARVPIHPGAFVVVHVKDATFDNVFRLPSTAIYNGGTVFVIEDSRLVAREVRVVGGDGSKILVQGALQGGERVLVTRISTPGTGVLVEEVAAP